MRNFWLIAKHEYRKRVGKRSFILAALGIPLLMALVIGASIFLSLSNQNAKGLGYVDQAGVLSAGVIPDASSESEHVALQPFQDDASAHEALERGEIQAYYILPPDYLQSRQMQLYYWDDVPQEGVREQFDRYVRANLAANQPPAVQTRLVEGPEITVRTLDGAREISSGNIVNVILPFVAAFLFFFTVMTSAGYLLQVVADEKENRTMEILITSLSPEQLIGGKAAGLMAVSLTQLGIWLLAIAAGLLIGAQFLEPLRMMRIPWTFLLVVILYFLPAFALIAAMMTAIGGAVTEMRQGQQIAGVLNLLFILPMLLSMLVFTNPDSPVLVFFTLFPTTSFVTVMLRWATSVIPVWQLAASWILLVVSAVLGMWASVRIFRAGMLRYGQSLDLRAALSAIRAPKS
jgi:ABC-2 type transport system permease protein